MKTRRLHKKENIPYDLLLLADETKEAINKYIFVSDVFVVDLENAVVAAYVFFPVNNDQIEIKNIAVTTQLQGTGIGNFLLEDAAGKATEYGYREIIVGTPESSHILLRFYEKAGFEKYDRRENFYIDNYPHQIIEDGVQLRDMILL